MLRATTAIILLTACGRTTAAIEPPGLPDNIIPCDGSVLPMPLDLANDAHRDLVVISDDGMDMQPGPGAEWAAGLDFFADEVVLPDALPGWARERWPPPAVDAVNTSTNTTAWSRLEQWEPGFEDEQGNSVPGEWWYQGDVRFDAEGRQTGWREEPLFSSGTSDWEWSAYGPDGHTVTHVSEYDGSWYAWGELRGPLASPIAWISTDEADSEDALRAAPMDEDGGLRVDNAWGHARYVRKLDAPDGYRADIQSTEWLEHDDGTLYRPIIQVNYANVVNGDNAPYIEDGHYLLNEGQTRVEVAVVGTKRVTTHCLYDTPVGPRLEELSYVVDDESGAISDLRLTTRVSDLRVGQAVDSDGDGVLDTGTDVRISEDGRTETEYRWTLEDGERVETVQYVLYRDEQGRPARQTQLIEGVEEDYLRWTHPEG